MLGCVECLELLHKRETDADGEEALREHVQDSHIDSEREAVVAATSSDFRSISKRLRQRRQRIQNEIRLLEAELAKVNNRIRRFATSKDTRGFVDKETRLEMKRQLNRLNRLLWR